MHSLNQVELGLKYHSKGRQDLVDSGGRLVIIVGGCAVPAPRMHSGSLTWEDVALAKDEYEKHYNCHIEFGSDAIRYSAKQLKPTWVVSAFARRRIGKPDTICGSGTCRLGGNTGTRSMPGAYYRAMLEAVSDLDRRSTDKRYDRDNPPARLPGL